MSFTCPDCESDLESTVREIELEEGEVATITEGGALLATRVVCSNGCSDKPKATKRSRSAPSGELCTKTEDCNRPDGHTGRCNHKGKPA